MTERMFGQYRLDALLGQGGMGEVHRAFDTRRHRTVALKLLRAELGTQTAFRERFRREALAAARLQEPHIVPIHDFGEIDGTLFIDMRLVAGRDIGAVLTADGPLSAPRALGLISQVADALDAAHAEGLVHRDVKPSNVLVTPADFAYLVDFGIARATEDAVGLTSTGTAVGTIDYMAPEQFDGSAIDHRVDVYGLTCLLFECLTGRRPFPRETAPALMHAHMIAPPPRPSEVRPGLPAGLDGVIARGMAKRPDDRFASAGELARAARTVVENGHVEPVPRWLGGPPGAPAGRPTAATSVGPPIAAPQFRPPGPPGPIGPPLRPAVPARSSGRLVAILAAALTLAVVAVGSTVLVLAGNRTEPRPPPSTTAPVTTTVARSTPPSPTPPSSASGTSTPSAPLTPANLALVARINPAVYQDCQNKEGDDAGAVAAVSCTNTGPVPSTRTGFRQFDTAAQMATYVSRWSNGVTSGGAGDDADCRNRALVGAWSRTTGGGPVGGALVCKAGDSNGWLLMVWSYSNTRVVAVAEGTPPEMYAWWQQNVASLITT